MLERTHYGLNTTKLPSELIKRFVISGPVQILTRIT